MATEIQNVQQIDLNQVLKGANRKAYLANKVYFVETKEDVQFIDLVSVPSNLGTGLNWYFVCPVSEKRCKKVYYHSDLDLFIGREGFKQLEERLYYPNQLNNGHERAAVKVGKLRQRLDKNIENVSKKYYKETYKGKSTKTRKAFVKAVNRYERKMKPLCKEVLCNVEKLLEKSLNIDSYYNLTNSSKPELNKESIYVREKIKEWRKEGF